MSETKKPVKLLAGDNPQIAKGYGEEVIQSWLDAVPGWKQIVCQRLDSLISETVPGVAKAVKWNTPLYGFGDETWFAGYHCTKNYIKVSFFSGHALSPIPPETSKQAHIRYAHIRETDEFNEDLFRSWFTQASKLPGHKM